MRKPVEGEIQLLPKGHVMSASRTGGLTTIAIFNIVIGSLGTLAALLVVVGGGLLAIGGAAMESELGADADGMGAAAAVGGGIILVLGLVGVVAWSMLAVSGIGVLKMAPWGRTLSIICGVLLVLVNGVSLLQGVGFLNLAFLGYYAQPATWPGIGYAGPLLPRTDPASVTEPGGAR